MAAGLVAVTHAIEWTMSASAGIVPWDALRDAWDLVANSPWTTLALALWLLWRSAKA